MVNWIKENWMNILLVSAALGMLALGFYRGMNGCSLDFRLETGKPVVVQVDAGCECKPCTEAQEAGL
jgi:hypothetical protein